jgi:hypothetical protein
MRRWCATTPLRQKQSQQWNKKGELGPMKAKIHARRGSTVNTAYIVRILDVFMKHWRKKRPVLIEQGKVFPLG